MLGFGLVSGAVKVFLVSSLSLTRKSTTKKLNEHDASGWQNGIPIRVTVSSSDQTGLGRSLGCMRSIEQSRVMPLTNSLLESHRDASASCCAFAHAQSSPTMGRSRDLGSHFVIQVRRARFFLVDFFRLRKKTDRNLKKTFTTPLTSPNPNMYVKFIYPWSSPLNL